jgi:hypothetical protein
VISLSATTKTTTTTTTMLNQSATSYGGMPTSAMLACYPNNSGLVRTLLPGHPGGPNVSIGLEVRLLKHFY